MLFDEVQKIELTKKSLEITEFQIHLMQFYLIHVFSSKPCKEQYPLKNKELSKQVQKSKKVD